MAAPFAAAPERSAALPATPLSPHSDEFLRVSYLLKLSLRSTTVRDLNVWAVANPHLTMQHEKRSAGLLSLDTWVDVGGLGDYNSLSEVIQRGFHFPPTGEGMVFETGNLRPDPDSGTPVPGSGEKLGGAAAVMGSGGERTYLFLLCKIAVGRSYVLDDPEAKRVLPPGYDSLYLHRPADVDGDGRVSMDEYEIAASHAGRPASEYHHEYALLDPTQVLPMYLVQFTYAADSGSESTPLCDVCEVEPAVLHCSADDANLCEECDVEMHSVNKLVARHVRVPLDQLKFSKEGLRGKLSGMKARMGAALAIKSTCPQHSNMMVEFFDPILHVPVCVHCKMVGSHSSGEAATHKLISIADAYDAALTASMKEDPMLDARKSETRLLLRAIDEKLRDINKNAAAVEEAIYQMLQEALFQLQDETQRKMSILLGEELELRRQLEQIGWVENFLQYQQDTLPPVEFLAAWSRHTALRSELHLQRAGLPRALDSVRPDIRLVGSIEVHTDLGPDIHGEPAGGYSTVRGATAGGSAADGSPSKPSTSFRETLFASSPVRPAGAAAAGGEAEALMSPSSESIIEGIRRDIALSAGPGGSGAPASMPASSPGGTGAFYSGSLSHPVGAEGSPYIRSGAGGLAASPAGADGMHSSPQDMLWAERLRSARAAAMAAGVLPAAAAAASSPRAGAAASPAAAAAGSPGLFSSIAAAGEDEALPMSLRGLVDHRGDAAAAGSGAAAGGSVAGREDSVLSGEGEYKSMLDGGLDARSEAAESVAMSDAGSYAPSVGAGSGGSDGGAPSAAGDDGHSVGGEDVTPGGGTSMTPDVHRSELLVLDDRLRRFRLSADADRAMKARGGEDYVAYYSFPGSRILDDEDDIKMLYFAMQPKSSRPKMKCLYPPDDYDSESDRLSVDDLRMELYEGQQTVIVLRSGDFVFGIFLGKGLSDDDNCYVGVPRKCFLWSLTYDLRIPYRGPSPRSDILARATDGRLEIGRGDLVLSGDLSECSSTLEGSFGVGTKDKDIASRLLAGAPTFPIDEVEVWSMD
eukprot:PLAT8228.1.p1 GENE.PLAT8228.1~~PLAT8228.1.p1  ORF type:complete len:1035 (+),score=520.69 PLAT8228.1:50-3154(+)